MGSETSGQLRRVLGLGFGLAVSVGGTIGVGILRTPGLIAEQFQSPFAILLLWIAGGIYTLLGASCLTELGSCCQKPAVFMLMYGAPSAIRQDLLSDGPTG